MSNPRGIKRPREDTSEGGPTKKVMTIDDLNATEAEEVTTDLANMRKLWKWLKENPIQVETWEYEGTTVDVISLPKGIYWLTEDSRHLFVRKCDKKLYDIVMACNKGPKTGAIVLGNPGIGKHNMPLT
mgnify:CR=1